MKQWSTRSPIWAARAIVVCCCATLGCNSKQRFEPNYGSQLQAVHLVASGTSAYYERNHSYPFHGTGLRELEPYGVPTQVASLVHYLDTNLFPVDVSADTICVIAARPTNDARLGACRYAGLVSGKVIVVPESKARLGAPWSPSKKRVLPGL